MPHFLPPKLLDKLFQDHLQGDTVERILRLMPLVAFIAGNVHHGISATLREDLQLVTLRERFPR